MQSMPVQCTESISVMLVHNSMSMQGQVKQIVGSSLEASPDDKYAAWLHSWHSLTCSGIAESGDE